MAKNDSKSPDSQATKRQILDALTQSKIERDKQQIKVIVCAVCEGSGKPTPHDLNEGNECCPHCKGTGDIFRNELASLDGHGRELEEMLSNFFDGTDEQVDALNDLRYTLVQLEDNITTVQEKMKWI